MLPRQVMVCRVTKWCWLVVMRDVAVFVAGPAVGCCWRFLVLVPTWASDVSSCDTWMQGPC